MSPGVKAEYDHSAYELTDVTCTSTTHCLAVGFAPQATGLTSSAVALYTTDATATRSVWHGSTSAPQYTGVTRINTHAQVTGSPTCGPKAGVGNRWSASGCWGMVRVVCPVTNECFAMGGWEQTGYLWRSTDGGKTWTDLSAGLPSNGSFATLYDLACTTPAVGTCVLVGYDPATPTHPSTPVIVDATGLYGASPSFIERPIPANIAGLSGVICATTTHCVATGIGDFLCPSGDTHCTPGVTYYGAAALTSTTSGSTWTVRANSPDSAVVFGTAALNRPGLNALACPTATVCLAVGGNQRSGMQPDVAVTTDGGTAWAVNTDGTLPGDAALYGISCVTSCTAVGSTQSIFTGVSPYSMGTSKGGGGSTPYYGVAAGPGIAVGGTATSAGSGSRASAAISPFGGGVADLPLGATATIAPLACPSVTCIGVSANGMRYPNIDHLTSVSYTDAAGMVANPMNTPVLEMAGCVVGTTDCLATTWATTTTGTTWTKPSTGRTASPIGGQTSCTTTACYGVSGGEFYSWTQTGAKTLGAGPPGSSNTPYVNTTCATVGGKDTCLTALRTGTTTDVWQTPVTAVNWVKVLTVRTAVKSVPYRIACALTGGLCVIVGDATAPLGAPTWHTALTSTATSTWVSGGTYPMTAPGIVTCPSDLQCASLTPTQGAIDSTTDGGTSWTSTPISLPVDGFPAAFLSELYCPHNPTPTAPAPCDVSVDEAVPTGFVGGSTWAPSASSSWQVLGASVPAGGTSTHKTCAVTKPITVRTSPGSVGVKVGGKAALTATVYCGTTPAGTGYAVTWTSASGTVATVSPTAGKTGTASTVPTTATGVAVGTTEAWACLTGAKSTHPATVATGKCAPVTVTVTTTTPVLLATCTTLTWSITGTGQVAKVTTPFARPLGVRLDCAAPKVGPIETAAVTWNLDRAPSGASGTFAHVGGATTASAVTDAAGVATSPVVVANATPDAATETWPAAVTITAGKKAFDGTYALENTATTPPARLCVAWTLEGSGADQTVASAATFAPLQETVACGTRPAPTASVAFTEPGAAPRSTWTTGTGTVAREVTGSGTFAGSSVTAVATTPTSTASANTTPNPETFTATSPTTAPAVAGGIPLGALGYPLTIEPVAPGCATPAISATPAALTVAVGHTATATATVRCGGTATAGVPVTWTSASPPTAAVSPATQSSATGGVAPVTVSGVAKGTTTATACVKGTGVCAPVAVRVVTPTGSGCTSFTWSLAGTGQETVISTRFAHVLGVTLACAAGPKTGPVTGAVVTWHALGAPSGASGTFTSLGGPTTATAATASTGTATSPVVYANATADPAGEAWPVAVAATVTGATLSLGTYQLANEPTPVCATFTWSLSGSGQEAKVSTAFGAPLGVALRCAGTPVTGAVVTWHALGAPSGASGTFTSLGGPTTATAATASTGTATSPVVYANATADPAGETWPVAVAATIGGTTVPLGVYALANTAGTPPTSACPVSGPRTGWVLSGAGAGQVVASGGTYAPLAETVTCVTAGGTRQVTGAPVTFTEPALAPTATWMAGTPQRDPTTTAHGTFAGTTVTDVATSLSATASQNTSGTNEAFAATSPTTAPAATGGTYLGSLAYPLGIRPVATRFAACPATATAPGWVLSGTGGGQVVSSGGTYAPLAETVTCVTAGGTRQVTGAPVTFTEPASAPNATWTAGTGRTDPTTTAHGTFVGTTVTDVATSLSATASANTTAGVQSFAATSPTTAPAATGGGPIGSLAYPLSIEPLVSGCATPTISTTPVSVSLVVGQAGTSAATVRCAGGGVAPGVPVTWASAGPSIAMATPGTETTSAAGQAPVTLTGEAVGTTTATACIAGTAICAPVEVQVTAPVAPTTTVLTVAPDPAFYATTVTLTATVNVAGAPLGAGTVTFYGPLMGVLCQTVPVGAGHATCAVSDLPVGTDAVVAVLAPPPGYGPSQGPATATVVPDPTVTTVVATPGTSSTGETVVLHANTRATVGRLVGGTVTFYAPGGVSLCAGRALGASGTSTCATAALPTGGDAVLAVYSGSPDDLVSSGQGREVVVDPGCTGSNCTRTGTGTGHGGHTPPATRTGTGTHTGHGHGPGTTGPCAGPSCPGGHTSGRTPPPGTSGNGPTPPATRRGAVPGTITIANPVPGILQGIVPVTSGHVAWVPPTCVSWTTPRYLFDSVVARVFALLALVLALVWAEYEWRRRRHSRRMQEVEGVDIRA